MTRAIAHTEGTTAIRALDYIEAWIPKGGCVLPHDGVNANAVTGLRYADHLKDAEFSVGDNSEPGAGAAARH
jgi:hypothetical protein